jgi:DNA-binding YbaB/EbfC family protein
VKNLGGLMKQAQALQRKMQELQAELGERTVTAQAGGGMVEAVVNGRQELVSLKIDPEVANPDDVDMLQDLVQAAINEALNRSREMVSQEMSKLTGGLQIPGMFG